METLTLGLSAGIRGQEQMKWQRGLFRLWLVLSVCWIVAVGAFTWATLPADEEVAGWARDDSKALPPLPPGSKPQFDPSLPYVIVRSAERVERIKSAAVLALAPPSIILVLGAAFSWAIQGFRP
jgi:hypothetical protein